MIQCSLYALFILEHQLWCTHSTTHFAGTRSLTPNSRECSRISLTAPLHPPYCLEQNGSARIYVPATLRDAMLHLVHDVSHPGTRTTIREVTKHFFWPDMGRDIKQWTRTCLPCQRAKVTRHNKAPGMMLPPGTEKFKDIHLDIVGQLTECQGYSYILTAVDHFSRWSMAEPMQNQTAWTVADTFIRGWVQNYGIPSTITTD